MDLSQTLCLTLSVLLIGILLGVWLEARVLVPARASLERRIRAVQEQWSHLQRRLGALTPRNYLSSMRQVATDWAPDMTLTVSPIQVTACVVGPADPITVGATRTAIIGSIGPAIAVAPSRSIVIEPPPRAAWEDRGWVMHRDNADACYEGYYQVMHRRSGEKRRYRGRVIANRNEVTTYIADPPAEIKRHPKGPCFQVTSAPWFRIHWHNPAHNVDDAILYVERILDEALNGRR